ncbi:MAG: tetratricopeptide repeat protein, partial [Alphaproteobacteria bacterium]|nr:tetratricopeptide repeat protein [Alphaproteobacteria bacterium]
LTPHPVLYSRVGIALCVAGRLDDAIADFEKALSLDPGFIEARANLGMVRIHTGNPALGIGLLRQALALKPDHAESWQMTASAAHMTGDDPAVGRAAARALSLSPASGAALALSALAYRRQGRLGRAFRAARQAVALDPRQADMLSVVALALRDIGLAEEAVRLFRRAVAASPRHADAHGALIVCLTYAASATPAALLAEARRWAAIHAPPPRPSARTSIGEGGPLRVGLVSGDLKRHPVGFFLSGVLPHVDRSRVSIECFATSRGSDALTETIKAATAAWHDIAGVADADAFDLIERRRIDILVDLSGHTLGGRLRLFALKPAPVQAAWIGYFGTTGLPAIDWLIGDERLIPPAHERWFTERIFRLPDSYVCYAPPAEAPPVAPPPADRAGYVTFGCCNALAKVSSGTIAAWSRILGALPDARLLLKTAAFEAEAARSHVRQAFAAHGISPDRITLEGMSPYREFLEGYGRIDIALDPFPFCGGLTTMETLWMGVPLVSLAGDRFVSRQSLSYLTAMGHPE